MTQFQASGHVAPGFERVKDVFEAGFARDDIYCEVGSSICAYHDGKMVVDCWGGYTDPDKTRPWTEDTTICVYSTTKAMTALCVAVLVDRGLIAYDDPVAKHWPEFGAAGKEKTTVSHVMSHQSGNPGLRADTEHDDLLNWDLICTRLAEQEAFWEAGSNTAYHGWTYGFLAGEIVRRVSGKSIGQFFQDEIAAPLNAEVFIGVPKEKDDNTALLIAPKEVHMAGEGADMPDWVVRAMTNPMMDPLAPNRPDWRAAELPALGGFASAKGLASIFAALAEGGSRGGVDLITPQGIDKMTEVQSTRTDGILGLPMHWAQGVAVNDFDLYGPNKKAFGHSGWGGSFVSADRKNRVAIGYVCNQMGPDLIGDPRATALVDAIYSSIG